MESGSGGLENSGGVGRGGIVGDVAWRVCLRLCRPRRDRYVRARWYRA